MPTRHLALVDSASRQFLQDGGAMGARMRAFPWQTHPLGNPETWPVALRVALRILLTTEHPIFIFWSPEYYCFYNDAYARSIGPEKHASMLGGRGIEYWSEIWDIIGPQLDYVSRGAGATWHENQSVPIIRHGQKEDVYWTYSYSPIEDPSSPDGVGGVLVICSETTEQILADRRHAFLVDLDDALRALSDPGAIVAPLIGRFPLERFGAENIALHRRGVTVARHDVTQDPGHDAESYGAIQTRSFVSVPLVRDGRFRASLFVNDRLPRRWSKHEINLIEAVAVRIFDSVERAHSEAALRLATSRFNLALNRAPVVLFSQDLELRYTWIHNAALGYRADEVLGMRDTDMFPRAEDARLLEDLKRQVIRSGESIHREVLVHDHDSKPRHYDLQIDPARNHSGQIEGVLCSAIDITVRKQAEAHLREVDSRKDVFLAVLSHELRSPLAPIQTAAQLLASADLKPEQAQWAHQVIRRQTRRMTHLLDDLLDIGRITQGKLALKAERVSLTSVVDAAIEAARPLLDRKHHRLSVALPPNPLTIEADPLRLSQVLANLLTNAAKYTDAGGQIELRGTVEGDRLRAPKGVSVSALRSSKESSSCKAAASKFTVPAPAWDRRSRFVCRCPRTALRRRPRARRAHRWGSARVESWLRTITPMQRTRLRCC